MTASHKLVETDLELIKNYLQANMPQALLDVSVDHDGDQIAALPTPKEYFTYEMAHGFRLPAIFIVPSSMDFRLDQKQANFIDASSIINVTVVIEDSKEQNLSYGAYRYQSAVHKLLQGVNLSNEDGTVAIFVKVQRARFSQMYTDAQAKNTPTGVFKKEIYFECDVEHYERLT